VIPGRAEYVAGVDIGKLTRNEQRCLDLCARFPNAVSCGGDHGPSAHEDLAARLIAAEQLEAILDAEFGDGEDRPTLLQLMATVGPPEDTAEAQRLYPDDAVEAERFLWRRFTERCRAERAVRPPPSKRSGPDHARDQRLRAQAKASRRANRRR
jgi:hypothetical protein